MTEADDRTAISKLLNKLPYESVPPLLPDFPNGIAFLVDVAITVQFGS
jgi:hypothetical protein